MADERILFFHSTMWAAFFSDLLAAYQAQRRAEVVIVCGREDAGLYGQNVRLGAVLAHPPDMTRRLPFEADSTRIGEVLDLVARCELAAGRPASRIILTAERDHGRGFARGLYYWPRNRLNVYCGRDNRRPQLVLARWFEFVNSLFAKHRPNLVLARSNNDSPAMTGWYLAALYGVPYFTCRFSKVLSGRTFWTDDYLMYNTAAKDLTRQYIESSHPASPMAGERIASFRKEPVTVAYIRQNWLADKHRRWYRKHRNFGVLFKNWCLYRLNGSSGPPPRPVWSRVVEFYRTVGMERRHARFFQTWPEARLARTRYLYYPLHKEPELMLNLAAPLWYDQRLAVRYLSSNLPTGYRLLVREHRFNWGRRYKSYLDYLAGLPGVVLIHPFDPQFKYIKHAATVVTDNGSTGWEALLLRRPVINLETTFYEACGLARMVSDPRNLGRVLLEAVRGEAPRSDQEHDDRLAAAIDAEWATTMDLEAMLHRPELSMERLDQLRAQRSDR
jgi:hypothetical protein